MVFRDYIIGIPYTAVYEKCKVTSLLMVGIGIATKACLNAASRKKTYGLFSVGLIFEFYICVVHPLPLLYSIMFHYMRRRIKG